MQPYAHSKEYFKSYMENMQCKLYLEHQRDNAPDIVYMEMSQSFAKCNIYFNDLF